MKRGRPTKEQAIINKVSGNRAQIKPKGKQGEIRTPIGTDIYIPNQSGDHSKGIVRTTPVNNLDIANKKYVDDENTTQDTAHAALYIPKSIITTRGDLIMGNSTPAPDRKAVGASGTTLMAVSAKTMGVHWAGGSPFIGENYSTAGDTTSNANFERWDNTEAYKECISGDVVRVDFQANIKSTAGSITFYMTNSNAGTARIGADQRYVNKTIEWSTVHVTQWYEVTTDGNKTFEMYWKVSGGGTATSDNMRTTITHAGIKVSNIV